MFRRRAASPPRSAKRRPRTSLGRRFALVLLPLAIVPSALIGAAAYFETRDILERQITSQLTSAAQAQVESLRTWTQVRAERLQLGAQREPFRNALDTLLSASPGDTAFTEAHDAALAEMRDLQNRESQVLFSELLVARPSDGTILVATNDALEGQALPALLQGQLPPDQLSTNPIFDDPALAPGALAIVSSVPMRVTNTAQSAALLVGVNSGFRLGAMLEEMQVFWEQRGVYRIERGKTYLAMTPDVVISRSRYSTSADVQMGVALPFLDSISSSPMGTLQYTSFDGIPVVGAYEWLPEWHMGVVVEVPQDEVFGDLRNLVPFILIVIGAAVVLTILIVVVTTNRMLSPLGRLAVFAERIARGEWLYRVPEDRNDEIGAVSEALNRMAEDLSSMYESLEQRVEERTRQIRTAAEVARAATSAPTSDTLLRQAVDLIRDQFGYYHVSIFLLNDAGDDAVLREATGEIGEALKARGHHLGVGSNSIIGWVTSNNQPRVASNVSEDPVHFKNELLSETRSEAAVPLQVAGKVIGALDVQSTDPDAFNPEDIEVLQTLADQLSTAIQNARLTEASMAVAERSRLITEVTTQVSGVLDIERVLRVTAQSLHRALGRPELEIRVARPSGARTNGDRDSSKTRPARSDGQKTARNA